MSNDRFTPDQEQIDELALRRATERDPTRTRGVAKWAPPVMVDRWPCRGKCGATVDVPEVALEAFRTFNRELRKRGEQPIDASQTIYCADCRQRGKDMAKDGADESVAKMAKLIRELKDDPAPHPERERQLEDQIRKLGHPDVKGMCLAIAERRNKGGKPKGKY